MKIIKPLNCIFKQENIKVHEFLNKAIFFNGNIYLDLEYSQITTAPWSEDGGKRESTRVVECERSKKSAER